jgi:hypothetical protein
MFREVLGKERARMKNRSSYAVLTRFGILGALLATLAFIAPVVFAADLEREYPENSTEPVATFNATDADGDEIVWGLSGDDEGDFEIEGGVLTFKDPPNFEVPADDRADNIYKVNVTASGGSFSVEVTVTDVDEPGKPTLTKPQPQVGRGLVAESPGDPDTPITEVTWQWARSMDMVTWEDIGTPAGSGSRSPTEDDEGHYLRATAMYTDRFGSGKTASVISENPVEERTVANQRPSFADHEDSDAVTAGLQIARMVDENAKGAQVGKPITAKDDDTVLVYELIDPDTATDPDVTTLFGIAARTGQITTKKALDSTSTSGDQDTVGDTDANEVTHTVTVKVVDPSGADASVTVVITVNNVNDAPAFPDPDTVASTNLKEITVEENATGTAIENISTYNATDDDAADDVADAQLTYILGGADAGKFTIGNGDADRGQLNLKDSPNYEGQKEYSVTVMAEDDEFAVGKVDVKVMVTNVEDAGSVTLNAREPQVGKQVLATLSDQDGTIRSQSWQWYRNATDATTDADLAGVATDGTADCEDTTTTLCRIAGATSAAYTPKAADVQAGDTDLLAARVTYTDACVRGGTEDPPVCGGLADGETDQPNSAFKVPERDVQIADPANSAPAFPKDNDPNTTGGQEVAEREVAENMETTVGDAVVAVDSDLLMYSVSDTDNFKVDNEGQISTKVKLDYEALPEDAKYYMVTLTAVDPSGASGSIMVKIMVTDEDDAPAITGGKTFEYPEGTTAVGTFSATDQDGDDIEWGLEGDDAGDFTITASDDGSSADLAFKSEPNFESPADDRTDNLYKVTVTASGMAKGTHAVEVTITDVDEPGKPTLTKPQPQVGRPFAAEGPNDPDTPITDVTWQWSRSASAEGPWEDIGNATASGSREPVAADEDMYLRATAMYTDRFDSGKTASVVSENPVEARTLANAQPNFNALDTDDETTGIQVARTVDENAKGALVGKPITATDDDDVLVYSVSDPDTTDTVDPTESFGIDARTAQLTTKVALDAFPDGTDGTGGTGTAVTHTIRVNVVDPSGATNSQDVTITVNDVNDAPSFDADNDQKTLWVVENTTALFTVADVSAALDAAAYAATDDDAADTTLDLFVGGADGGKFKLSDTGELTFDDHTPNYEGQMEYSITLMVEDDEFALGTFDVTVTVRNAEDAGSVSLNAREPQVGKQVLGSLSDQDGTIRSQSWQWYKGAAAAPPLTDLTDTVTACAADDDQATVITTLCLISGATSPAYTPKAADVGEMLLVRVSYTDGFVTEITDDSPVDAGDVAFKSPERVVQIDDPANTAPKFADDQDPNTPGDQPVAEREVPENMETTVGDAIVATDTDLLMYSVDPDDNFKVDNDGQISTKVKLDYEGLPEDAKYYMVTLTAVDPSGASDSIMVKITVTDGPDDAEITLASGGAPDAMHPCVEGGAVAADQSAELAADCQTLLDAMDDLIGDGDGTLNWSADLDIGDWDGVAQRDTGRVGGIYLSDAGLSGVIPASFNDLAGLERLTLRDNDLGGDIPDLSGLDNLEWLVLQRNAFTGSIPGWLGDMESLDYLLIYSNEGGFEGGIPAGLGNSTSLRQVWLYDNGLAGGIPAELGNMSRLRYLVLSDNNLAGAIPAGLADATNLKQLYLHNNMLSGMIPAELGSIMTDADDTLRRLYLNNNMLSGDVPSELGMLTSLTHLRLNGNDDLMGCIPANIFDAVDDGLDLMACAADDES